MSLIHSEMWNKWNKGSTLQFISTPYGTLLQSWAA